MTGSSETYNDKPYVDPYLKLLERYGHLFDSGSRRPFAMFGFECGDGWYDIIEQLIEHIDHYFTHKYKGVPEGFRIVQVKEKFGGLRFYVDGGDDVVYELIRLTESMSYHTCEFCGSNQNVMRSKGWIITACEQCTLSQTNERLEGREWVKVK